MYVETKANFALGLVIVLIALLWGPAVALAQTTAASPTPPAVTATPEAATPADAPAPASTPVTKASLPRDLSVWGMFSQADWVVQAVMLGPLGVRIQNQVVDF